MTIYLMDLIQTAKRGGLHADVGFHKHPSVIFSNLCEILRVISRVDLAGLMICNNAMPTHIRKLTEKDINTAGFKWIGFHPILPRRLEFNQA